MKRQKKLTKKQYAFWFTVALAGVLLAAPNATILRSLTLELDPFTLNALRGLVTSVVAIPFLFLAARKYSRRNVRLAALAGFCMFLSLSANVYALKYSQASYAVTISLLAPIMLVFLSSRIVGERINVRAVIGLALAAIGALMAVTLPLLMSGGTSTEVYPLATVLLVINSVLVSLGTIFMRKAHEAGLPLPAVSGIVTVMVFVCSAAMIAPTGSTSVFDADLSPWQIVAIIYSAAGVAMLARILHVASYEKIGSVAHGGLSYLQIVIAILIPIFVLGERLSIWVVAGGIVILLGVAVTERVHLHRHRRQFLDVFHRS